MRKLSLAFFFVASLSVFFFVGNAQAAKCAKYCVSWYDGCNTCGCKNGRTTFCTKRFCVRKGRAYCKKYLTCRSVRCAKPRVCRMLGKRPACMCPKLAIKCARGYVTAYRIIRGCKIPYCKKLNTCANVRCAKPKRCVMIKNRPRCICPKLAIKCAKGYVTAYKIIGGCRIPYCRRLLTCANVRCAKPKRCRMIKNRPVCVCPRVAIKCAKGYVVAYRNINGCRIPYCRRLITCANVRCAKPKRCRMIKNRPVCVCPRVAIKCARGYVVAYRNVGGCKMPYCRKVTITCANVRCRSPRRCKMIKNRPVCLCPKIAIRCAPGYLPATKIVGGCKIPYCRKCTKRCARNCKLWYDGCNRCTCVNGCATVCTKKYCKRKGRPYCIKR